MKSLFALTYLLSFNIYASWYQEHCSNSDATTRTSHSHNSNSIIVTITDATHPTLRKELALDHQLINLKIVEQLQLRKDSRTHCQPPSNSGYIEWETVSYRKIHIAYLDDGEFVENIIGLSSDRKYIEAEAICLYKANSRSSCL